MYYCKTHKNWFFQLCALHCNWSEPKTSYKCTTTGSSGYVQCIVTGVNKKPVILQKLDSQKTVVKSCTQTAYVIVLVLEYYFWSTGIST